jgi:DNA repair protein RadC
MDNVNTQNAEWEEIPEYSVELVRDRSVKYRKLPAGHLADKPQLRAEATAFVHKLLDNSPMEQYVVILLDKESQVVGSTKIASGNEGNVNLDIRSIFRAALVGGVNMILLAHNQPGGQDAKPTRHDIVLTATAIEVGQLLGVEMVDHIIVSPNGTDYSMWENRGIFEQEFTAMLKEEVKTLDVITEAIAALTNGQLPPEVSGSLGTMNVASVRQASAKDLPNLLAENLAKAKGITGKGGPSGNTPPKNSN